MKEERREKQRRTQQSVYQQRMSSSTLPPKFNVMFKFNYSKISPPGAYFPGSLYMEGVFRFKSWFLNAPGLIYGGAYYRNFTVFYMCQKQLTKELGERFEHDFEKEAFVAKPKQVMEN